MGLDITAYRGLTNLAKEWDEENWKTEFLFDPTDEQDIHWPGRSSGLAKGVYSFSDKMGFRAGSYGGYSAWRNELAKRAGYLSASHVWNGEVPEGAPFTELINFSDCEGVIGPVVAAKLARDFAEHQDRLTENADEYWSMLYRTWRQAFEMAADNGAVEFH